MTVAAIVFHLILLGSLVLLLVNALVNAAIIPTVKRPEKRRREGSHALVWVREATNAIVCMRACPVSGWRAAGERLASGWRACGEHRPWRVTVTNPTPKSMGPTPGALSPALLARVQACLCVCVCGVAGRRAFAACVPRACRVRAACVLRAMARFIITRFIMRAPDRPPGPVHRPSRQEC